MLVVVGLRCVIGFCYGCLLAVFADFVAVGWLLLGGLLVVIVSDVISFDLPVVKVCVVCLCCWRVFV